MESKLARKRLADDPSPYVSNLGGGAGGRVLPPGPVCSTVLARALPDDPGALRRLTELYAANTTDLIACHDAAGRLLWVSERAREVLGRPCGSLLGRAIDALAAPDDRAVVKDAFRRLRSEGGAVDCVYRVRLRNGRRRWVETRFRAVLDRQGALREVQSSTRSLGPRDAKRPEPEATTDQRAVARLRELAAHLESRREQERAAMAREIHDDMGHQLTALSMELHGLAVDLEPSQPELAERARALQSQCTEITRSMRRVVTELRPVVLDDLGLSEAIEWRAADFARHTGIATRVEVDFALELEPTSATAVYRIFQESLTNVARHSGAANVVATLREKARHLELEVKDDGRGFDARATDTGSFGLLGMRERALALGGDVHIESRPGAGTTVRLRVPL